jgi:diguanylate cyclase
MLAANALRAPPAALPTIEAERLATLRQCDLLDTLPEPLYDDIVMLASQICGTPIALVSLVDRDRQWFKARTGLAAPETHRDLAFCAHAILEPEALFVVEDARRDPRFATSELVTGGPHIRFYAGAPIVTAEGHALGTVCVIDTAPRVLSAVQAGALRALARQATALIESRRQQRDLEVRSAELEALSARVAEERRSSAELLELVLRAGDLGMWDLHVPSGTYTVNDRELQMLGITRAQLATEPVVWSALVHRDDWPALNAAMAAHLVGRTSHYTCEHRMRCLAGHWIWVLGHAVVVERDSAGAPVRIVGTHADITGPRRVREHRQRSAELLARMGSLAQVGGWEFDLESQQISWTDEVYRIHEVELGTPLALERNIDFYAPEAQPVILAAVRAAIEQGTPYDLELPLITARGRRRLVRAQGEAVRCADKVVRLIGAFQDITERKRIEGALVESERRMRLVTDQLPAVICLIDRDQRYRFVNAEVSRAFGVEPEALLGRTMLEVRGPEIYAALQPHVEAALAGEAVRFEYPVVVDGKTRHMRSDYVPDRRDDGSVHGFYAATFDITDLKETQQKLESLALIDSLTGLPNRRQFEQRIAEAMARTRRNGQSMAVMFLDIDHFKTINDTLGHAAGDAVLVEFGRRLRACVRVTDTVARLAGDEFVLLLENVGDSTALRRLADKVVACIRPRFLLDEMSLRVTTSVGVARFEGTEQSAFDVLSLADDALYAAKHQGRDRYSIV